MIAQKFEGCGLERSRISNDTVSEDIEHTKLKLCITVHCIICHCAVKQFLISGFKWNSFKVPLLYFPGIIVPPAYINNSSINSQFELSNAIFGLFFPFQMPNTL